MDKTISTVVLRFRDFSDPTIDKHQDIIRHNGYVWWGWWRKKGEPANEYELSILYKVMRERGGIDIGLWDSEESRFYTSSATACHFSHEERYVASPEPELTPDYYSDSENVSAWFRLQNIERIDEDEFRKKFGGVPQGERTLFKVFENGDGPVLERSVREPETQELRGNMILHLSDLHFGDDHRFPIDSGVGEASLIDVLINDIEQIVDIKNIGMVVVSGDLTTKANANSLLDSALSFLEKLSDELRLEREFFVIVPGNHDIPLDNANPENSEHESRFRQFLNLFYRAEREITGIQTFLLPNGKSLNALLMNSVRLRSREMSHFGFVQWNHYEAYLDSIQTGGNTVNIGILHHHLVQSPRIERVDQEGTEAAKHSTTLDAGDVTDGLQKAGFDLVLSGHQHVPGVFRLARGRQPREGTTVEGLNDPLWVVSSGSSGASHERLSEECVQNCYNLLRIQDDSVDLRVRSFTTAIGSGREYMRANLSLDT